MVEVRTSNTDFRCLPPTHNEIFLFSSILQLSTIPKKKQQQRIQLEMILDAV